MGFEAKASTVTILKRLFASVFVFFVFAAPCRADIVYAGTSSLQLKTGQLATGMDPWGIGDSTVPISFSLRFEDIPVTFSRRPTYDATTQTPLFLEGSFWVDGQQTTIVGWDQRVTFRNDYDPFPFSDPRLTPIRDNVNIGLTVDYLGSTQKLYISFGLDGEAFDFPLDSNLTPLPEFDVRQPIIGTTAYVSDTSGGNANGYDYLTFTSLNHEISGTRVPSNVVPEPSSIATLGLCILGYFAFGFQRRQNRRKPSATEAIQTSPKR